MKELEQARNIYMDTCFTLLQRFALKQASALKGSQAQKHKNTLASGCGILSFIVILENEDILLPSLLDQY